MNSLALTVCREYIDSLVAGLQAGADLRARFGNASKAGFLTDVNGTLDHEYSGRNKKRLLDIFLADFKEAGGNVCVYSGVLNQKLPDFQLPKAFANSGEAFVIEGKPIKDLKTLPPIVIDDSDAILQGFKLRGFVTIDPLDQEFERFLESWHDLRESLDDKIWAQRRAELLSPLLDQ